MTIDHRDKVPLRVTRQRGLAEMLICRDKIFRRDVEIGEVAATAAGDKNFFTDAIAVLDDENAPSPRRRRL